MLYRKQTLIACLLFEARDEVVPKVGASIGMFASGSRILDQLGVYDDLFNQSEEATFIEGWKDGALMESNENPKINVAR